ncbi:glutamine amidotransferase [archaeon BMS3Bbin15]|nr:glutamine amidotransferase [archaeon BMS3Bbin15]
MAIENAKGEHLGYFETLAEARGIEVKYRRLWKGDNIEGAMRYDLAVILGGPMSVNEEEKFPYLAEEKSFIKRTIGADKPLLGICLGSQLIASALGAEVYPSKGKGRELGWYPLRLTEEGKKDIALSEFPESFDVFQWHGETFDLPENAILLASSELYKNQAFRIGKSYALQFHFEVTWDMILDWSKGAPEIRDMITRIKDEKLEELNSKAEIFFDRWLEIAGI